MSQPLPRPHRPEPRYALVAQRYGETAIAATIANLPLEGILALGTLAIASATAPQPGRRYYDLTGLAQGAAPHALLPADTGYAVSDATLDMLLDCARRNAATGTTVEDYRDAVCLN